VGIADLTGAAAIEFEHTVLKVIIAAVLTGFVTLAQNTAEQGTVAPPA
jgi:Flp pilus assembly pilin Flp